ncbi:MAG: DUF488 family protein [Terriglobia bacterium]|jgi:uncharacterized protein YeaO (DUF488 family)|nr:DUF488 family protein [Terriglobia bacterium]
MAISIKRIYDTPLRSDGARVLVDRLWPRGLSKDAAKLTAWLKALAPSDDLRKWYHARPSQWLAFRKKYLEELRGPEATAALEELYDLAEASDRVTLLFASRNLDKNNATVLKELLEGTRKPPATSGAVSAAGARRGRARAPRT